jgi:predicted dehydrogenase
MKNIRIGVIGVGQIGKRHVERYKAIPGAQVVAVADIDQAELQRVAAQYDIPHTYASFCRLLERDDIDSVDVCLHNNFHAPVTIAALRAGKNVYCEKPMAGAYVDAKAMYDEARRLGRKLSVQLNNLFSKPTKMARRLIQAGKLGRVYHARSTGFRRRGRPYVDGYGTASFVQKRIASGGALYDMGVYHIAQVLFLMDMPRVERISGKIYQETAMDPGRRDSSGYDVEELGVGLVRLAGGVTLDIVEAWAMHLGSLEGSCLIGSEGGIRLDPFCYHSTDCDAPADIVFDLDKADTRWHSLNEHEWAYDSSQHHWIAAQQGIVDLLPIDEVALQTMLISEGVYLSDRLGREVTAEEVLEHSESTAAKL